MYYDLIASLPHLPHFSRAERLPISPLRLKQRLRLLPLSQAEQLEAAYALLRWRPQKVVGISNRQVAAGFSALLAKPLHPALHRFVDFRYEQLLLLAALRSKQDGLKATDFLSAFETAPHIHDVRRRWTESDFGLAYVHPWLPRAREFLAVGQARELEQLLMQCVWIWLEHCVQRMFGFEAVFAYLFKWDIIQAWLSCNAEAARVRFQHLVDQVIHVDQH